nr:MAG TPA: hypothetical protein [Caudoviricetes sp.]
MHYFYKKYHANKIRTISLYVVFYIPICYIFIHLSLFIFPRRFLFYYSPYLPPIFCNKKE